MARRAFFSFHYERDVWRASVVRNSWVAHGSGAAAGFWDYSLWEEAKKKGDYAIKRMIDTALEGTSVTVVLIGAETAGRKWIKYEIKKSFERNNGMLGVYIHGIRDTIKQTDLKGLNPFAELFVTNEYGQRVYLSEIYPTYDWVRDDGFENLGDWVEEAVQGVRQ